MEEGIFLKLSGYGVYRERLLLLLYRRRISLFYLHCIFRSSIGFKIRL